MKIPIPRFNPDKGLYDPSHTAGHRNILPTEAGYIPMPDLAAFSSALGADCRGGYSASLGDGSFEVYLATATDLFRLSGTGFTNVSKSAAVYTLPTEEQWAFTQWRDKLIASNVNDPHQVITVGVGGNFADLAGSPPKSRYSAVIGPHLVLGNILNATSDIAWSGVLNIEEWTAGIAGSGRQTLSSGGAVQNIAGWQNGGFVFQESEIRSMRWAPGTGAQFQIERYEVDRGLVAPWAMQAIGKDVFFLGKNGFYKLGNPSTPIGAERVDRWFSKIVDRDALQLIQAASDPLSKTVLWRFKSVNGGGDGFSDMIIGYDWEISEWFVLEKDLQFLLTAATAGYTLEGLDALGYTIDTLPFSLDSSVWKGGKPLLAGVDASQMLGFFNSSNLEATIESNPVDVFDAERVTKIQGFTPVVDTTNIYGQIGTRQRHAEATVWSAEKLANKFGKIKIRKRGRTIAIRNRIPAGQTWTQIDGWIPAMREGGRR